MSDRVLLDGPAIPALLTTIVIVLAFAGLGRAIAVLHGEKGSRPNLLAFDVAAGWGIATSLMVIAALIDAPLHGVAWSIIVLAGVGIIATGWWWRDLGQIVGLLVLVLALLFPLILIAAVTPAVMFDEFGHWLSNARFVFDTGVLPNSTQVNAFSDIPAYPYGGPFIDYFASVIASQWLGAPSKLFAIVLFGLFGAALADAVGLVGGFVARLGMIAAGVALATVLNPAFDPRIALTAYMDTPSGALLALTGLAVWNAVVALERGRRDDAHRWFWRGGYVALCMVATRDTNLVLLGGLGLGLVVAGAPMLRRNFFACLRIGAPLVVVPALGLLLWRLYRALAELPEPLHVLPLDRWQWGAVVTVIWSLFRDRLQAHPVLGTFALAGIAAVLIAAAITWRRGSRAERGIVEIAAVTSAIWFLFLGWAYTATMDQRDVGIAMSLWRYAGQLAPLLLLALVPVFRWLRTRFRGRGATAAAGAAILALYSPLIMPAHWRNDCNIGDVLAAREIAEELRSDLKKSEWVYVVHPQEASWLALAVAYELYLPRDHIIGVNAAEGASLLSLLPVAQAGLNTVLDLRAVNRGLLRRTGLRPPISLYAYASAGEGRHELTPLSTLASTPTGQACRFF